MFTALNPVEFSAVMSVGRHIPTLEQSNWNAMTELQKACALDAAGDKYKSEGKLESAKFAYARAAVYAAKHFNKE